MKRMIRIFSGTVSFIRGKSNYSLDQRMAADVSVRRQIAVRIFPIVKYTQITSREGVAVIIPVDSSSRVETSFRQRLIFWIPVIQAERADLAAG